MRINVYSQELTKEVELVTQLDRDGKARHWGVRFYMASPEILHNTPDDDDRSAVTFWIPNARCFSPAELATVLRKAADMAESVPPIGDR